MKSAQPVGREKPPVDYRAFPWNGRYFSGMVDPSRFAIVLLPLLGASPAGVPGICDRWDVKCRFEHLNDLGEGLVQAFGSVHSSVVSQISGPAKDMSLAADLRATSAITATLS